MTPMPVLDATPPVVQHIVAAEADPLKPVVKPCDG